MNECTQPNNTMHINREDENIDCYINPIDSCFESYEHQIGKPQISLVKLNQGKSTTTNV